MEVRSIVESHINTPYTELRSFFCPHTNISAIKIKHDGCYKIFVSSPEVEGVHIRFARYARGGIRITSHNNYYKECMRLAQVQHKKNLFCTVGGAKGCLYPLKGDNKKAYEHFITGVLKVFDNSPQGEDNVFLCAADVGTSQYLELASSIATSMNFWMADKIVTGSLQGGLNHKESGITSRGALTSLYTLSKDYKLQKPYSVIAVGSPKGDVFSNFFRWEQSVMLKAAISSRFIVLNPHDINLVNVINTLAVENKGWEGINKQTIVLLERSDNMRVDSDIAQFLHIGPGQYSDTEIIKSVLALPVDVLYFAGIGTYIGSKDEAATSPALVSSDQVKSKIIIEGANLACTEQSRYEMTCVSQGDFFDNSAAVMLSDYEVHIKFMQIKANPQDVITHVLNKRQVCNNVVSRLHAQSIQASFINRARLVSCFYTQWMILKDIIGSIYYPTNEDAILKGYMPFVDKLNTCKNYPLKRGIIVLRALELLIGS